MIDTRLKNAPLPDRLYGKRTPLTRPKRVGQKPGGRQECGARAGAILNSRPARANPGRAQEDTRRDRPAGREATNAAPRATPQPKPTKEQDKHCSRGAAWLRGRGADLSRGARAGQNNTAENNRRGHPTKKKMSGCACIECVQQSDAAVVEKWGGFSHTLGPGMNCVLWPIYQVAGTLSLKVQQLEVRC